MMKVVLLALAALAAVQAKSVRPGTFQWNNCNGNWSLMQTALTITPDPIVIPGSITVDLTITGTVAMTSPTAGDFVVSFLNTTTGNWDPVPCYTQGPIPIGSCYYDDICIIFSTKYPPSEPCPATFTEQNVPCNCPFPAGTTSLTGLVIDITNSFSFLADGDYRTQLSTYDATGAQIGCLGVEISLAHA